MSHCLCSCSYVQFSRICAMVVRRCLKAEPKAQAMKREEAHIRAVHWKDGKAIKGGEYWLGILYVVESHQTMVIGVHYMTDHGLYGPQIICGLCLCTIIGYALTISSALYWVAAWSRIWLVTLKNGCFNMNYLRVILYKFWGVILLRSTSEMPMSGHP